MANKEINTGLIMDSIANMQKTNQTTENKNESVVNNTIDNQKMMQAFAEYKKAHTPKIREYKIGRNDPCPCGSGKKFKHCCLSSGKYEEYSLKQSK